MDVREHVPAVDMHRQTEGQGPDSLGPEEQEDVAAAMHLLLSAPEQVILQRIAGDEDVALGIQDKVVDALMNGVIDVAGFLSTKAYRVTIYKNKRTDIWRERGLQTHRANMIKSTATEETIDPLERQIDVDQMLEQAITFMEEQGKERGIQGKTLVRIGRIIRAVFARTPFELIAQEEQMSKSNVSNMLRRVKERFPDLPFLWALLERTSVQSERAIESKQREQLSRERLERAYGVLTRMGSMTRLDQIATIIAKYHLGIQSQNEALADLQGFRVTDLNGKKARRAKQYLEALAGAPILYRNLSRDIN